MQRTSLKKNRSVYYTRNFNDTYTGTNYQLSSMQDHSKSENHQRAVREEEHDKALKEGISVTSRKVVL